MKTFRFLSIPFLRLSKCRPINIPARICLWFRRSWSPRANLRKTLRLIKLERSTKKVKFSLKSLIKCSTINRAGVWSYQHNNSASALSYRSRASNLNNTLSTSFLMISWIRRKRRWVSKENRRRKRNYNISICLSWLRQYKRLFKPKVSLYMMSEFFSSRLTTTPSRRKYNA